MNEGAGQMDGWTRESLMPLSHKEREMDFISHKEMPKRQASQHSDEVKRTYGTG